MLIQPSPLPPPPQEREFSVPMSSRSTFPRALKKFAFPRARVPKTPGTRERGNAGARIEERAPSSENNGLINNSAPGI